MWWSVKTRILNSLKNWLEYSSRVLDYFQYSLKGILKDAVCMSKIEKIECSWDEKWICVARMNERKNYYMLERYKQKLVHGLKILKKFLNVIYIENAESFLHKVLNLNKIICSIKLMHLTYMKHKIWIIYKIQVEGIVWPE